VPLRKRSIVIAGHATSVSLEAEFWAALKEIADARATSINRLVADVDLGRADAPSLGNLSSALRVFILEEVRRLAAGAPSP